MANAKTQQKILKTFLKLLASHPYEDVSLPLLAREADVKLSDLRACFSSKRALVEAFAEQIDKAVLDDRDDDMADQPARDRLFDVLMIRIDQLAPYKDAMRALHQALRKDPGLALEFNSIAVRSQKWMLVAAGIEIPALKGRLVTQGLAVAFARVVDTWLDEDDEGMPRTMSRLDKELDRGEGWLQRLDKADKIASSLRRMAGGARRRRRKAEPDDWASEQDDLGEQGSAAP
ncbi:TetR/AcrR family transcriptional regulator [Roseibium polysiphoniae]|uniref:TetR/AcrR family transcriptional regulator n=1 Tax=Roseibium polysiphoniae TaxID=2571221 RepID=UPI003297F00C